MAPVHRHILQSRQSILPPRPAQGPPGQVRAVNSAFGFTSLLSLFVASFLIFVAAIFCWKISAFLRIFTRHRVIAGGKEAGIRYAKTWYGWVPLDRRQKQRQRRQQWFKTLRGWLAWRTCHTDYSWVWWDPQGKKLEKRVRDQQPLSWIPSSLTGYVFDPAGSTSSLSHQVKRPQDEGAANLTAKNASKLKSRDVVPVENSHFPFVRKRPKRERQLRVPQEHQPSPNISNTLASQTDITFGNDGQLSLNEQENRPATPYLPPACKSSSKRCVSLPHSTFEVTQKSEPRPAHVPRCVSDGASFKNPKLCENPRSKNSTAASKPSILSTGGFEEPMPTMKAERHLSWRYKAWGARMQRATFPNTPIWLCGLAGRPGTPFPDALRSLISTGSGSECCRSTIDYSHLPVASDSSMTGIYSQSKHALSPLPYRFRMHPSQKERISTIYSSTDRFLSQSSLKASRKSFKNHSDNAIEEPAPSVWTAKQLQNQHGGSIRTQRQISNPEVRLLDDLERKLEWLSSEMDPGRKTDNFSVVYNHWLNKTTWVVYDPPSRVPSTERRLYGDPRFNYPYQAKSELRKAERPPIQRSKLHTPKIDSWRLAVNSARQSAGVQRFLKAVELFEGSADEPPDGAIDTATWILRKPPQGFEMSTKQKNAYFEGCGGWCEKLDYWQNVPRAYRARKVICEGKANRRRVAEVAKIVTRGCKRTVSKVVPRLPQHSKRKSAVKDAGRVTKSSWHPPPPKYQKRKKLVLNGHRAGLIERHPNIPYAIAPNAFMSIAASVSLILGERTVHPLDAPPVGA
ncbi:hypothetical protein CPC735_065410 [Coccidioides posadasii C735 delta SOWgp]|uniref:Uncharacterized protein n=2 Tax=Coccidioides posadasii TaxID=199306 RepID=A0A0J6FCN8_COCPO|nr:hypothetical protein CPC735_065410 [Coccidioides posadasii C735 delta SOWgp]EER25441.1 hypothetical protein CPC735_065410 [Coccidioides posadasii C735 delta SOWgp]KMM70781.1 hypothetical protein CPAG_07092 [Coccidioides posadasii RMSCC 3488]|eukprot:XP_003067586.1 hypothetical protein CPC735_065410 [Coccidioides posadasii C735 delta SOWgp]